MYVKFSLKVFSNELQNDQLSEFGALTTSTRFHYDSLNKRGPFPLDYEEFDEINYFTGENYFKKYYFKLFICLFIFQKCEMISLHQK